MQLETKNYTLRLLRPEDATERYLSWLRDLEVSRNLEVDGLRQTLETLRDYITAHDGKTKFLFGIFTKDGVLIGTHSFSYYPNHKLATCGVMIGDRDYWGKAVPLETRARVLDFAFDELGCEKVEAGCYSINLPALYNFIHQKWAREGIRKAHRIIDGKSVDMVHFGMQKSQWKTVKKND